MKPMRQVAQLLNDMMAAGVISNYAVFGAVAQMRYTEAIYTADVDVLIDLPDSRRLDVLAPVYAFCTARGLKPEGQYIRVGDWPVQFLVVPNALARAAMEEADVADFEGLPLRVVRADYLALVALDTGRDKDFDRIIRLRDAGAVTFEGLAPLAMRHGLSEKLKRFLARHGS